MLSNSKFNKLRAIAHRQCRLLRFNRFNRKLEEEGSSLHLKFIDDRKMVYTNISGTMIKGPYQEIKYVKYLQLIIKNNKIMNFT